MIELPEALNLAYQLKAALVGKTVRRVLPPTKKHKFCWFNGEPDDYDALLRGARVTSAEGFGIIVEMAFDNGAKMAINDGVNPRLYINGAPKDHQLLIEFTDDTSLAYTVAMYGGIYLHHDDYDNEYYLKSRAYVSPFSESFRDVFYGKIAECKSTLSAKAFVATEQRFPGVGNGTAQDILFAAGIHPKRKLATLDDAKRDELCSCMVSVLHDMYANGGRDTEKDIYGEAGRYATRMSRNTLETGCPVCGGSIVKENYLGGSVYYCPSCQPLVK